MNKALNAAPWRRMMTAAGLAAVVCTVAGCTPEQQQVLTTFTQDFLRNLLAALAL